MLASLNVAHPATERECVGPAGLGGFSRGGSHTSDGHP
jgi:hypothetical protein